MLPVPRECGLEPRTPLGGNPMVGFHVLQDVEEVNPHATEQPVMIP